MRDKFFDTEPIPVSDLSLDLDNFRHYGQLKTQQDCFRVIIDDDRKHFLEIAQNIAKKGLTPQHIIVLKNGSGKWIVRDGNRRVVALKCLNMPSNCPDDELRKEVVSIANKYSDTIPESVVCLGSEDDDAIYDYMELLHGGLMGGAGQKKWDPQGRDAFGVHRGRPAANAFAQHIIDWVRSNGVSISHKIYITNVTRFLGTDVRERLGLSWDGSRIACADKDSLLTIMKRVLTDIDTGKISVDKVRTADARRNYLDDVLKETGCTLPAPEAPLEPLDDPKKGTESKDDNPKPTPPRRPRPTPKASWDRKHLIPSSTQVPAPANGRARNAYVELKAARNVDIRLNPNAVALLFRAFIEWSVKNYIETHACPTRGDVLKERFWSVALDLKRRGLINDEQELLLEKKKKHDEIISINSMNKWVHSDHFHPSPQTLCMFWDEIEFFIAECWK